MQSWLQTTQDGYTLFVVSAPGMINSTVTAPAAACNHPSNIGVSCWFIGGCISPCCCISTCSVMCGYSNHCTVSAPGLSFMTTASSCGSSCAAGAWGMFANQRKKTRHANPKINVKITSICEGFEVAFSSQPFSEIKEVRPKTLKICKTWCSSGKCHQDLLILLMMLQLYWTFQAKPWEIWVGHWGVFWSRYLPGSGILQLLPNACNLHWCGPEAIRFCMKDVWLFQLPDTTRFHVQLSCLYAALSQLWDLSSKQSGG